MAKLSEPYGLMAWILTALVCVIAAIFTVGRKSASGRPATVVAVPTSPLPVSPVKNMETPAQKVYDAARSLMGQKIYDLLDSTIPAADGCAASVSYVLQKAGYTVPPAGLPTVNELISWMLENGFQETTSPVPGSIITAHNPDAAVTTYAHCGVLMAYGICSNTSFPLPGFSSGEWAENYRGVELWKRAFSTGGSDTRFFTPV